MARKRRSKEEWAAICRAYTSSGEPAAKFAIQQGLKLNTLMWWLSRLRQQQEKDARGGASGFVEVVAVKPPSPSPAAVVRVGEVSVEFSQELPPAQWVAELASRC